MESAIVDFQAAIRNTVTITNECDFPHEFVLIAPVTPGMADMHGETVHAAALAEVPETALPRGATYTLVFTFPESVVGTDLEIACHTPGHYEADMRPPITVK